jgi:hypothetical protein
MSKIHERLERRITDALSRQDVISYDELQELIKDTGIAIEQTDAVAKQQRAASLDLIAAPVAEEALNAAGIAELRRDRLKVVLPKLEGILSRCLVREHQARWDLEYARVRPMRDAVAARLNRVRELQSEIIAAFREAEECDKEVNRVNADAPIDEPKRLQSVEQKARDVINHTSENPSMLKATQLYDWETGKRLWPKPEASINATLAAMAFPSHVAGASLPIGPNWWQPEIQDRFKKQAQQERSAHVQYLERQTEKQEAS